MEGLESVLQYDCDEQDADDMRAPETDDEEEEEEKANGDKMEVEETPGKTEVNGTGEVEKPVSNGDSAVEVCVVCC